LIPEDDSFQNDDSQDDDDFSQDDGDSSRVDDDHKNDGGSDDVDKETCIKVDKEAFRQSFEKIPESTKLKLSSGKVIEDLLFNYVKDNDYEE
jgi:hypothetical protein